ncbi:Retinal pigment epithelial membrane protein [Pseudomonas sp. NFACC15-1]|uniref:carotenoid oxygenase family protein n=1 Tax=unclassified Pseudomonas TaxID=196821 RepID=UPI0008829A5A|nr:MULTISPECIES: carotenoid oxygenase family protein [unclassified Pseudomonas]SDA92131.1 Retinal pigment epithelial membrane protein [Pseudomonas sp. NFACC15-1]SDY72330.1 Retinal pigment epithelial membrane protein [Pseudomonas sp. NFACC14]
MNSALRCANHHMQLENYRPVDLELWSHDLGVTCEVPAGLHGPLFCNASTRQLTPLCTDHYLFFSKAMVNAGRIKYSQVSDRTHCFRTKEFNSQKHPVNRLVSTAFPAVPNGQVFAHGEFNFPVFLDPGTLETEKLWDADGKYYSALNAHPKVPLARPLARL